MAVGIIFIALGILIAVYPELLAMLVAAFIIMVGVSLILISFHFKKAQKDFNNPFIDFFVKF